MVKGVDCVVDGLDNTTTRFLINRECVKQRIPYIFAGAIGYHGNVTVIDSVGAAKDYLKEYDDDLELVLQQRLNHSEWTEMTVDLLVSDTNIEIANTRKILFSEGVWVGNYLNANLELDQSQQNALLKVGEYARELGYSSPEGLNCGLDFLDHY